MEKMTMAIGRILTVLLSLLCTCVAPSLAAAPDDYSGVRCGVRSLGFSVGDATKSISVNGGEGPHFTFKRGLTIGSGEMSSIRSFHAENDLVVIQLDDAYTDVLALRQFEFRQVPVHCVREINAVLKKLNLRG